jgi:L-fuconolactonase
MTAPRIDSHVHFWHYDPVEYPWIDDRMSTLQRDHLPGDVLAELRANGFDACVAIQARQDIAETQWLLDLATEHRFIAGVVGWIDLQAEDVGQQLAPLAGHPLLVGLRHIVQSEADGFLDRPAFRRGVAALERAGLAYDILIYARQLPEAIRFAAALPDQRFVLDHLGKPDITGKGFDRWRGDLDRIAALPNVWAKLSGLVTEADWGRWTRAELHQYVHAALAAFGPMRLMIGSDWPVCTLAGSYGAVMDVVVTAIADRPADERDAILGETARRFWNLEVRA